MRRLRQAARASSISLDLLTLLEAVRQARGVLIAGDSGTGHASKASSADKTITATVESLVGGCLRGDNLIVKVAVDHTKHIKSLNGVILTLYRQARVDMHPALPIGPTSEGDKRKYEDYYPKSLTGLGGLSLSGAGSSHVFRKDLAQAFMPLMVDPRTLTAEVHAKVRVPEEAFPTISCVPGSMISFKYYVEVVIDIQGKLAGQQRYFPHTGVLLTHPAILPLYKTMMDSLNAVVVGTVDSERKRGKQRATEPLRKDVRPEHAHGDERFGQVSWDANEEHNSYIPSDWHNGNGSQGLHDPDDYYGDTSGDYAHYTEYHPENDEYLSPPVPDDEDVPEKERLRRAEARLLPSQPPGVDVEYQAVEGASAPVLESEHAGPSSHWMGYDNGDSVDPSPRGVSHAIHSTEHPVSETVGTSQHWDSSPGEGPSAPHYLSTDGSDLSHPPTDDKQELQRRRLQLEASAPPGCSSMDPDTGQEPHAASAPIFPDEDDACVLFDTQGPVQPSGTHPLPRYER
ncbi:ph-response sensor protein [Taxawa tesnikishii (nom. ined.)]|nr:ph-response sensor protein [Dothideales sp. JES 119]